MKITHVKTIAGNTARLFTDDIFTLAFEEMVESTPTTLSQLVSTESLRELTKSADHSEAAKAERALNILGI